MPERLAVKLLQHSDITLFRPYFERNPQTRQKAINLNANVFIDLFYPTLQQSTLRPYRIELRVYGPGLAGELLLQRKILKEQKNWRLDGELIDNPPNEPQRFNDLSPGDIAIIGFDGVVPDMVQLYLISAANFDDAQLHMALAPLVNSTRNTMIEISVQQIKEILQRAGIDDRHPVWNLMLENALEDAAHNGIDGIRQLQRVASQRRITVETLQQAHANSTQNGRMGEELINSYFSYLQGNGDIESFEWVSDSNAVSPFDFQVTIDGNVIVLDVKTTTGPFENPIHISYNELLAMRSAPRYDLYRVSEVTDTNGNLRIARNMRGFAESVLNILEQLPKGICPDSISVQPEILQFEEVV